MKTFTFFTKQSILLLVLLLSFFSFSQVTVSTFVGNANGSANGTGTNARFYAPSSIAVDASGNFYVADYRNHRIRKVTPAGVVTTFAGSSQGFANGTGTAAQFNYPNGVAVDGSGNVYVADTSNNKIRKITPSGVVTTLAGSTFGFADGAGSVAQFAQPFALAVDVSGNVYVADTHNNKIRKVTPSGTVTTFAGSTSGFADGIGTSAQFSLPSGIMIDASGNIYVGDTNNHKIRKITSVGVVSTIAGSTSGYEDGANSVAKFNGPNGLTLDSSQNIYVADYLNHKIRKITPAGVVSTIAGSTGGYEDGEASVAKFYLPIDVAIDTSGNIFVVDFANDRIRKITNGVLEVSDNVLDTFGIYPNPTTDVINLNVGNLQNGAEFSLYDSNGILIKKQSIKQKITQIDIRDLPEGFYMLSVKNQKNTKTFKVIKN